MPPSHTPISTILNPLLRSFRSLHLSSQTPSNATASPITKHTASSTNTLTSGKRAFTSSSVLAKKQSKRPKKTINDQRVALIRYFLQHPLTPRPLRFGRLRALRHWTIHRAWLLFRRKKMEAEKGELYRMHQSMHAATEALRTLDAPGTPNAGRLYRIAMEKKGVFGHGGVPIEYARLQVETPGKEVWNHGWKR